MNRPSAYDDWRLPRKAELIEAVSHDAKNYFEGWGGTGWTSDKLSKNVHWAVNVNIGVGTALNDGSALISSAPVRGTRTPALTQPSVRVFTENMTLTEGAIARFSVVLDKKPTANVTIAVSSTDATEQSARSIRSSLLRPTGTSRSARMLTPSTTESPMASRLW